MVAAAFPPVVAAAFPAVVPPPALGLLVVPAGLLVAPAGLLVAPAEPLVVPAALFGDVDDTAAPDVVAGPLVVG